MWDIILLKLAEDRCGSYIHITVVIRSNKLSKSQSIVTLLANPHALNTPSCPCLAL